LLAQLERRAFSRARANTGKSIAARIAMMAITTNSSIRVNARLRKRRGDTIMKGEWSMGFYLK